MKKTLLTAAVIVGAIAAVSCQKESSKENPTSAPQFTATIEDGSSTKTTVHKVDGDKVTYKTYWENTDQISVNGAVYKATPTTTDATKADFNYTSGTAPTGPTYYAYYPVSVNNNGNKGMLPANYEYVEGKYNMPMYAESTTTRLSFKNLCGVLAITVPSTQITSVSSITVTSNQQMNGAFTANSEGVLTFDSKMLDAADKKVTLNCSPAKSIGSESSATFYIPVPAGKHKPLTIIVSDGTNHKTMETKQDVEATVERNKVYQITFTPAPQFTATIEDGSSTKTTVHKVDGDKVTYKTYWESTDQISVNGAVYTASPTKDPTKADFKHTSGTFPTATYHAYYPSTVYDGTTATLPASYTYNTYEEGKYNMPMYALSNTTSLSFKNLCGVLAITVPSTQIESVKTITVTSDKRMNGAFTAKSDGVLTFDSAPSTADDMKVTLTFSEPKSIGSGSSETFYIPVPAGTHNPLTITVYSNTGQKIMETKKSEGVQVVRNTVYPITFADNQPEPEP